MPVFFENAKMIMILAKVCPSYPIRSYSIQAQCFYYYFIFFVLNVLQPTVGDMDIELMFINREARSYFGMSDSVPLPARVSEWGAQTIPAASSCIIICRFFFSL
jgi:hypothetical protein